MSAGSSSHPGCLHRILKPEAGVKPLTAFEHQSRLSPAINTLIFLGGLSDGLLTVPYVPHIVSALPSSWTLVEPTLSSSYRQWGFSALDEDAAEIAVVVQHFRSLRPQGAVVLLGHSTGCQQVMSYLLSTPAFPAIDGAMLQASVSDREAMGMFMTQFEYESACKVARSYSDAARGDDILPSVVTRSFLASAPISANRWLSLALPGGEDDFFSSDLDDIELARTIGSAGRTGTRLSFLFSGQDEYVPANVNKEELVSRWHTHFRQGGGVLDEASGIVPGASHTLKEEGKGMQILVEKIMGFLGRLEE